MRESYLLLDEADKRVTFRLVGVWITDNFTVPNHNVYASYVNFKYSILLQSNTVFDILWHTVHNANDTQIHFLLIAIKLKLQACRIKPANVLLKV